MIINVICTDCGKQQSFDDLTPFHCECGCEYFSPAKQEEEWSEDGNLPPASDKCTICDEPADYLFDDGRPSVCKSHVSLVFGPEEAERLERLDREAGID